jgi:hypothetical protein
MTPWLGLASYEEKDAHLFFGRSAEIEELFNDIVHNTQTVVFGPSGTGKTSIIRAGLFGLARKENFFPVYVRLDHDSKETYSIQIIRSIEDEMKKLGGEIENLIPPISETKLSLWEFLHINLFWNKENYSLVPLLVIDQFEEIFTLAKDKEKSAAFFEDLSDLCDNKMPNYIRNYLNENKLRSEYPDKINYRIVLSLREDFLARLEEQANNILSLRRNRFSLQTITSEQAMEIIMKPGIGIVTENVAREIIKKVSKNEQIETSILSLFCNELNNKRIERNEKVITLDLVNEFGDNIIADFYEQIMKMVTPETEQYLETVLLSDDGLHRNNAIRRDVLSKGVTEEELEILQHNRLIRIEEWDGAKRIEFTHDVLCKPAKERREKRNEILKIKEERQVKTKKIMRYSAIFFAFCLVIGGIILHYGFIKDYSEYYENTVKRYGFPTGVGKNLTKEERESTASYFKLSRKGYWGNKKRFTKMEAFNAYGEPTVNHNRGAYLVSLDEEETDDKTAIEFSQKLKTVCRWEFVPDANGSITQEIAYTKDSLVVFVFTINRISKIEDREEAGVLNKRNVFYGVYTDAGGIPIQLRDNGADRLKITYDTDGFEVQYLYYDASGIPRYNYDFSYGERWVYNNNTGCVISYGSTDAFGDYMIDRFGNCGMRCYYEDKDDIYKVTRYESFDDEGKRCNIKYGYAINIVEYPDKNTIIQKYFDKDSVPVISTSDYYAHICEITKDSRGNIIKIINKGTDDELLRGDTCSAIINMKYDKNGNCTYFESLTDENKLTIQRKEGYFSKIEREYTLKNKIKKEIYTTKNEWLEEPITAIYDEYFYDKNDRDTLLYYYQQIDSLYVDSYFETKKYNKEGTLIEYAYWDEDGNPIERYNYHKWESEIIKLNDSTKIVVDRYLNLYDNLTNNEDSTLVKDSSVYIQDKLIRYTKFDINNKVISSYLYEYDKAGQRISQSGMGIFDTPIRNNEYDGILYYKTKYFISLNGNLFMKFVNEFEESAYGVYEELPITEMWSGTKYTIYKGLEYNVEELSNNDKEILKKDLPCAVHLRVLSKETNAYKYEIQDGDILIQYGKWEFSFDNYNLGLLDNEIQRLKDNEKTITVVRHFPETKESKLFSFQLPKGMMGIAMTDIYYTEKEKERLNQFLKNSEQ